MQLIHSNSKATSTAQRECLRETPWEGAFLTSARQAGGLQLYGTEERNTWPSELSDRSGAPTHVEDTEAELYRNVGAGLGG